MGDDESAGVVAQVCLYAVPVEACGNEGVLGIWGRFVGVKASVCENYDVNRLLSIREYPSQLHQGTRSRCRMSRDCGRVRCRVYVLPRVLGHRGGVL